MSDIFISYARKDRGRAKPLAEALEAQGWTVWWDPKIPPGKTFADVIDEEISAVKCILALWSKISIKKNWVLEEAQDGLERGILVPVLIEGVKPPRGFRRIQAANLIEWGGLEGSSPEFQTLVSSIADILGPPPVTVSEEQRTAEKEAKRKAEAEKRRRAEREAQSKAEEPPASQTAEPAHPTVPSAGPRLPMTGMIVLGGVAIAAILVVVIIGSTEREPAREPYRPAADAPAKTTQPPKSTRPAQEVSSYQDVPEREAAVEWLREGQPKINPYDFSQRTAETPTIQTSAIEPETDKETQPESREAAPQAAGPAVIQLRFLEDSWVEMEANGRKLVVGVQPAGSERTVRAEPPIQILLGNAPGVELTYRGEAVDITPHQRGKMARLTLDD